MGAKKDITYTFKYIDNCNMCGAPFTEGKVIGMRLNTSQGLKPKSVSGLGVTIIKCGACDLIYSNPLPIPANIGDHYNIEPEEYWGDDYFSGEEHKMDYHAGIIKRLIDIKPGAKALDIGTGVGLSMLEMQKMGFDTYGIEPSETFVKYAIEKNGLSPDRLTIGMVEDGNYKPNYFDFILMRVVLEHVYNPAECIEKAMGWLKPDGVMHIEVPSSNHLIAKFINLYYRLVGTNYVTNLSPAHSPYHLHEFSAKAFQEHGKKHGYDVVLTEYYPANVFFFPRFTHSFLQWIMRKTNTGMQIAVWLKKKR